MSTDSKQARREAYQEKIESKRERYADRAERARQESGAAHQRARDIGSMIPMGQPILVGHHSERRHRKDLARIDSSMRKAIDLDSKAAHYESKAETYGTNGISSDNPDAIDLLRAKLGKLEEERDSYKAANKVLGAAHRKAKKANGGEERETAEAWETIIAGLDVSNLMKAHFRSNLSSYPAYRWIKFGYQITNLGANIRTVQKRIKALEAEEVKAEEEAEVIEGEGFSVEECPDDNRIRFFFDGKPAAEVRKTMKQNGFRWSPKAGAWQRHLNNNGRSAAKYVARLLSK